MKTKLLLFAISLFLVACSNDDKSTQPEEQNSFKIKKYTSISLDSNGSPNGEMVEYFFDENGKKTKDHIINSFYDYFWKYTYNNSGQVTRKAHDHLNYPIDFVENYYYGENSKPWIVFRDWDNDGADMDSISFSYQSQQINVQWHTPGQDRTEFTYNNAEVLTTVKHIGDVEL